MFVRGKVICAIYFLREKKNGAKNVCSHNTFYCKTILNHHVKDIHGARRDACKESKFSLHRQSDMLYQDMSGGKNLHGESETVSVHKN